MLLIHAETNIPQSNDYTTIDIIKLYLAKDDLKLEEKKYNYEFENSILNIDDDDFSKYPTFEEGDAKVIKNMLDSNSPIIVLSHYFMKKTLAQYDINLDEYETIDIVESFKKLKLYGDDFSYKLDNVIETTMIDTGLDRNLRGFQMIDLYQYLVKNTGLNNDELVTLNYDYKSNYFDSSSSKFANKALEEIPYKLLLSMLTFDALNIKLNDCTTNQFKFNLIRFLLEDNENVKDLNINKMNDKKIFDETIKNLFIGNERAYNVDLKKIDKIYKLCDLYFKVNNNNIDLDIVKDRFLENTIEVDDIEQLEF